jgi:hypothetical protein
MTLIKLVKLFVLWSESDPLPVTDTSTDTPCPPEVERLVISGPTGAQLSESEWQSDCESLSTSPLFALFTCCLVYFEVVLGSKEFKFVGEKRSFYCPRAMRLMTLIKLVKLFVLWSESDPLPVTDTSTDTF